MFSQGLTITLVELPILSDFRKLDKLGYSKLRAAALGEKSQKPRGVWQQSYTLQQPIQYRDKAVYSKLKKERNKSHSNYAHIL